MLPGRYSIAYQTKSLTWWANDKPEVESLLRALLDRKQIRPASLAKKKGKFPIYLVTIALHDHGNAEDFHFGRFNKRARTIRCELDLTRIAAHGRKQRLNCAMEESKEVSLKELADEVRLVLLTSEEYHSLKETVISKLH